MRLLETASVMASGLMGSQVQQFSRSIHWSMMRAADFQAGLALTSSSVGAWALRVRKPMDLPTMRPDWTRSKAWSGGQMGSF